MNEIKIYNRRQILLLEQYIDQYKAQRLSIGEVISNLCALLGTIKEPNTAWYEEIFHYVWQLEEIYAVALDSQEGKFDEIDQQEIEKNLSKIEELIKTYKKENKLEDEDFLIEVAINTAENPWKK